MDQTSCLAADRRGETPGATAGFAPVRTAEAGGLRLLARRWAGGTLRGRATEVPGAELRRSALVFAPHPDDETLGCGGTIIKKKQAGAAVGIVYLADGSLSDHGATEAGVLARTRKAEGLAAAAKLGVEAGDVIHLNFKDGRLTEGLETVTNAIAQLLAERRPEEVYMPTRWDGPPDHLATYRAVTAAAERQPRTTASYEYPVWFWHCWPWTPVPNLRRPRRHIAKETLFSAARLLRGFRSRVYVGDVLSQKRAALEQHRTQFAELEAVSEGRFLACFFEDYEFFARGMVGRNGA